MNNINQKIRETVREWIQNGEVDVVIGFRNGTQPHRIVPHHVKSVEDADKLVFSPFCYQNLVTYLRKTGGRVGVVLRGCDGKALIELLKEQAIDRNRLKILAVSCSGVFDKPKLKQLLGRKFNEIENVIIEGQNVHITARGKQHSFPVKDLLAPNCRVCRTHISPVADVVIGDEQPSETTGGMPTPELSREERWEYFKAQMQKCIRCYACRNVCPMCGCETCFVDRNNPQWVGKSIDESDVMIYHMIRSLHLAGRCVSCGACRQACPADVDMGFIHKRLKKTVSENFGYQAGEDPEKPPVMQNYSKDDPEEFIE